MDITNHLAHVCWVTSNLHATSGLIASYIHLLGQKLTT